MMLLFSPCKRCPCPCSDVVLCSVKKHWLGSFSIVLPPSLLRGFVPGVRDGWELVRAGGQGPGRDTIGGGGGGRDPRAYMYVYIYIYVCVCVYIYIYIMHISAYIYNMYICMHACMHARTHAWMYVCMYVCVMHV